MSLCRVGRWETEAGENRTWGIPCLFEQPRQAWPSSRFRRCNITKSEEKVNREIILPGAAIGTPMTYLLDGKQYIAITVQGRATTDVPELIALTLP